MNVNAIVTKEKSLENYSQICGRPFMSIAQRQAQKTQSRNAKKKNAKELFRHQLWRKHITKSIIEFTLVLAMCAFQTLLSHTITSACVASKTISILKFMTLFGGWILELVSYFQFNSTNESVKSPNTCQFCSFILSAGGRNATLSIGATSYSFICIHFRFSGQLNSCMKMLEHWWHTPNERDKWDPTSTVIVFISCRNHIQFELLLCHAMRYFILLEKHLQL